MLSLLGDLGGLFEIVMMFFAGLTSYIILDSYETNLLHRTYQVQHEIPTNEAPSPSNDQSNIEVNRLKMNVNTSDALPI